MSSGDWDDLADWWQCEFTEGADPEYEEQILPLAVSELASARRVLDIGCGEGQLARRAHRTGAAVVGFDPAWSQVREAVSRGGGPRYLQADATAMPFPAGCFDAVLACLVFEHIDDLEAALAEVARVLAPGGRFLLFLNHPLLQAPGSAWVDDHIMDPPARYWRVGPYLEERAFVERVTGGIEVRFVHRPLHRYVNAMARVGLLITGMAEPAPPAGFLDRAPEYAEGAAIPRLMLLRAARPC